MISLNDLKACKNSGNIFSKKVLFEIVHRYPAWKNVVIESNKTEVKN